MENWKIQLVVVTFCVLVQTFKGSTSGAEDERRLSRHWQYEPAVDSNPVDSLMKRSKALRFYGLMGKRAVTKKLFQVKRRNKGVAFVDLMGQRVSNEESVSGVNPSAATRDPASSGTVPAGFPKGMDTLLVLIRHKGEKEKHLYNVYINQRL